MGPLVAFGQRFPNVRAVVADAACFPEGALQEIQSARRAYRHHGNLRLVREGDEEVEHLRLAYAARVEQVLDLVDHQNPEMVLRGDLRHVENEFVDGATAADRLPV